MKGGNIKKPKLEEIRFEQAAVVAEMAAISSCWKLSPATIIRRGIGSSRRRVLFGRS